MGTTLYNRPLCYETLTLLIAYIVCLSFEQVAPWATLEAWAINFACSPTLMSCQQWELGPPNNRSISDTNTSVPSRLPCGYLNSRLFGSSPNHGGKLSHCKRWRRICIPIQSNERSMYSCQGQGKPCSLKQTIIIARPHFIVRLRQLRGPRRAGVTTSIRCLPWGLGLDARCGP